MQSAENKLAYIKDGVCRFESYFYETPKVFLRIGACFSGRPPANKTGYFIINKAREKVNQQPNN